MRFISIFSFQKYYTLKNIFKPVFLGVEMCTRSNTKLLSIELRISTH